MNIFLILFLIYMVVYAIDTLFYQKWLDLNQPIKSYDIYLPLSMYKLWRYKNEN